MFIKMLPDEEKDLLVELAKLLALSDNTLLWDGKTKEELTSDSDLNKLSIQKHELETELLDEMKKSDDPFSNIFGNTFKNDTEALLIEKLKSYPLAKIDAPENRLQAAKAVLRVLLDGKKTSDLVTPKVFLFQLFLVALRDGKISNIEWMLLKEIQQHYLLPDFIFEDLLQRSEALNSEICKTLALILE